MEINKTRGGKGQGSFGIPPHMQDQINRMGKDKKDPETEEEMGKPEQADFMDDMPLEEQDKKTAPEKDVDDKTPPTKRSSMMDLKPEQIFEDLGVEFTPDDFQHLLFKGFVEKEIVVTKFKNKEFTATVRTLTSEEYDMIDEIMTEEVKDIPMSPKGYEARRSVLIGAFGVKRILDKPLCKEVKGEDGKVDRKAMALERRNVLKQLAPPLINRIMEIHNALSVATNLIVRDPGDYGKNS